MTRVDDYRNARSSAAVKYKEFTDHYHKFGSQPIYCIFEGEDVKYYGIRIDNIIRPTVPPQNLDCGGKEEVLRFYRIIKSHLEYQDTNFAYFIDRDFDESIRKKGIDDIYETLVYSIENFYTSINVFQKILEAEFKLKRWDDDFKKCSELYQARQNEFHQETKLLNAWVACQREYQNQQGNQTRKRENLKNFKLDKYISVDLDKVTSNYTLQTLSGIFPEAYHPTEDIINQKIATFDCVDCQKNFREKFETFFLYKFFEKLKEAANTGNLIYFSRKINVSLNISKDHIISNFSQYAETPNCLRNYLESFKN